MPVAVRTLETGLRSARWNTALSAALLAHDTEQPTGAVLRFYQFNESVLLGATQQPSHALNWDYCTRNGIEIARRITGGGSVYMTPRMLAWDFVMSTGDTYDAVSQTMGSALTAALTRLGAETSFRPPNDVLARGRKISGAAATSVGRTLLLQGTLLIEDEASAMSAALGLQEQNLRQHLTCLAHECSAPVSNAVLRDTIARQIAEHFGASLSPSELTAAEWSLAKDAYKREMDQVDPGD